MYFEVPGKCNHFNQRDSVGLWEGCKDIAKCPTAGPRFKAARTPGAERLPHENPQWASFSLQPPPPPSHFGGVSLRVPRQKPLPGVSF